MKSTSSKNLAFFAVVLAVVFLISGMGFASSSAYALTEETTSTVSVAHLSDLHIMPAEYCNPYSAKYNSAVKQSKLLEETTFISEAVLEEIYEMEDAPMYLFLTGDFSSNGEYETFAWLSSLLKVFTTKMRGREGYERFQIFITPGNHDLYNARAISYMPSDEALAKCTTEEQKLALLSKPVSYSVKGTTSIDFMNLFADFGYCSCPDRKNGHHLSSCGIIEGCKIEYFFESEYWYDSTTKRSGQGLEVTTPSEETIKAFENSDKDYSIYSKDTRFGVCSYIARLPEGIDIVSLDSNCRAYKYEDWQTAGTVAEKSCFGWQETTGGMVSEEQLKWVTASLKNDVAENDAVFALGHINFIPHFDTEDEVISLFTYDNWEQASYVLADAGIRYTFSGHQHAADTVNYVSQKGNVVYDIESGSFASYGCHWRTMDFVRTTKADGTYIEDFVSLSHNLNSCPFTYGTYQLTSALKSTDVVLSTNPIDSVYNGITKYSLASGSLSLVKKVSIDHYTGEEVGVADMMALQLHDLAGSVENGLVGSYVGENIFTLLESLTSKIDSDAVAKIVSSLKNVDLCKFSYDGNNYTVGNTPTAGYSLADFTHDFASFLLQYDFSFGQNKNKFTIADAFMIVYGGHLAGTHTDKLDAELQPLLDFCNNGGFVRFLITLLEDSLLPQLEIILDLPIRFDSSTPVLTAQGFDIANELEGSSSSIDGIISSLPALGFMKETDENGYTSLRILLGEINTFASKLLSGSTDKFPSFLDGIKPYIETIQHYYKKVETPLQNVIDGASLRGVIDDALVNKYVTDAFCKNLGNYASGILVDFDVDYYEDGSRWIEGDRNTRFPVENYKYTIKALDADKNLLFDGHTFMKKAGTDGAVKVTPTIENGLLPGLVTVSFNNSVDTEKNIAWFTKIQQNIFDTTVPDSFIRYSTSENLADATLVKAEGINVDRVLPTIDLGILFFNMTHSYQKYNKYSVTLTNLTSGTTYYYQLGNDATGWSQVYKFATASDGEFSFMAITDIQGSVEKNYTDSLPILEKALSFIGDTPAFIVSGGDNVDNGKNIMQYTWLFDGQREIWSNNTFVTTAGNHEDEDHALDSLISLPAGTVTSETGYYYSYDYNCAHFIILNTNDLDEDEYLSTEQTAWLENDLDKANANTKIKWTIVILHKGPYTAGSHAFDSDVIALREQLTPLFYEKGVDLVLQGHDHTYSVSEFLGEDGTVLTKTTQGTLYQPQGVLYINLGTMGDKFYDYIYHEDVDLMDRTAGSLSSALLPYLTADNNLELTETPVFADITVNENELIIKTYTVINGEIVLVDDITVSHQEEPDFLSKVIAFIDNIELLSAFDTTQKLLIAGGAVLLLIAIIVTVVIVIIKKRN